ncbi:MAG: DUF4340 domain-containing protein [Pirellulales bacterium]
MSNKVKSIIYLGVALLSATFAIFMSREAKEKTALDVVGETFVDVDPREVIQLRVVSFNSTTGKQKQFEVAKVGGIYAIPSHDNYPADAEDRIENAVTIVNQKEIIATATKAVSAHEEFGVVDPDSAGLSRGARGVGTRVTMSQGDGESVADFIIGNGVADQDDQHYVRRIGEDQVFVIKINPDELSTKFEDWVERDFLKFDTLDVRQVTSFDYSIQDRVVEQGIFRQVVKVPVFKAIIDLAFKDSEWSLDKIQVFEKAGEEPKEVQLADNEELDDSKLNDMKSALDDLEIVDVHRKTASLDASKWDELKRDPKINDILRNFVGHGFHPTFPKGPEFPPQFISNNGELRVGMKDGVTYVLRFGETAGGEKSDDGGAVSNGEDAASSADVLRYLFVMAEFDKTLIDQPELEEVPTEAPPTEEAKPDPPASGDGKTPPPDNKSPKPENGDDSKSEKEEADSAESPCQEEGAADAAAEPETDAKAPPVTDADGKETPLKIDPAEAAKKAAEEKKQKLEEWKQNRERIIRENDRKTKDYEKEVEKGKKRVDELNERFKDWYYVINDKTYGRIRLGQDDIIKEKEKTEEEKSGEDDGGEKSEIDRLNELKNALPEAEKADDKDAKEKATDAENEAPKDSEKNE